MNRTKRPTRFEIKLRGSRRCALLLTPLAFAVSGVLAQAVPGGTLDPTTIPKYVTPLVIPGVMKKSDDPLKDYEIALRQFRQQMLPTQGCNSFVQPAEDLQGQGV